MGPIPLSFDVTDALPADVTEGRPITIAAWLFLPDDLALLGARPVTLALLAGGSYDKRYYHIQVPGRTGYSAAEHLAGLGDIVLLLDHLGVGDSTRVPQQKKATRFVVAQAMDAAVRQFYERLAAGTLVDGLPAIADFARIGGGHSMGAMMTVIQQARHRTYDAIMVLGYTADGVHMTMGGKLIRAADLTPAGGGPDYPENDRAPLREGFHWEDVPDDVVTADNALAVPTPSAIGLTSIATGIIRAEAAQIDVPVYFCNGERDVSPDLHAEPGYFRACTDFTLQCLPRSAHCQNFAGTRHLLWDRMHRWSRMLQQ
jgi:hypothetical protein